MHVHRHPDAGSFLGRARPWLMRSEVENNLVLRICDGLTRSVCAEVYLATVEHEGQVAACAVRTPPHKAVITRGNRAALACLVDDLIDRYGRLPAVLGPEPDVGEFAQLWSQRAGTMVREGMKQRVFENREVQPPLRRPEGTLRLAGEADLSLLGPWVAAFNSEAGVFELVNPFEMARQRIAERELFVWDIDRPVSMAAQNSPTPTGAGISLVYTPPALRGRGYASICVAELTRLLLAGGRAYCCLFTDLANPTSNRIYQRIGYRPVCDMTDFILETG